MRKSAGFIHAFMLCCFTSTIFSYQPVWAAFWFALLCLYIAYVKLTYWQISCLIVLTAFLLVWTNFLNPLTNFQWISDGLDGLVGFSFRTYLLNHLSQVHEAHTAALLQWLLFNSRSAMVNMLRFSLVELTILHLFVLSGWHVHFLTKIIQKAFSWNKPIGNFLAGLTLLWLLYCNNFAFPIFRAICFFAFDLFKKTKQHKLPYTVLLFALVIPKSFHNVGVLLTFFAIMGIKTVSNWQINNLYGQSFLTGFFVLLGILPLLAIFNNDFSLWAIFFSILWTPLLIIFYPLAFLFGWFAFASPLFSFFTLFFHTIAAWLQTINVLIPISFLKNVWVSGLWTVLFSSCFYFCSHQFVTRFYELQKI